MTRRYLNIHPGSIDRDAAPRDARVDDGERSRARAMDPIANDRAKALLTGYDEGASGEKSPAERERQRRERLEKFAKAFASEDESASEGGEGGRGVVVDDWSDSESEREAWRAMERGEMSPALDRATRRRNGRGGRETTSTAARSLTYDVRVDYNNFAEAEAAVRMDGERALSGVAYAYRSAESRTSTLEDSARKLVNRVETKVSKFEREADDYAARRLEKALNAAALSETQEEDFRRRIRQTLTRQSRAYEDVIEALDRELVQRIDVAQSARERMQDMFGAAYVEEYERGNEEGHDATLTISRKRNGANALFKLVGGTVVTAFQVVRLPLIVVNGVTRTVFGTRKERVAREVEDYREFRLQSPDKTAAPDAATHRGVEGPLSPSRRSEKSDVSSLATTRRWPLGATAQRVNAHKRYSVAGSVRSAMTRKTIYSQLEYGSEEDNDENEFTTDPGVNRHRKIVRTLTRLIQLGCFTAVVSLSVGPSDRALRSRQIALKIWKDVEGHVSKGWSAFLVRWTAISAKLSSTPTQQQRRNPTKVQRSKVPIQVPAHVPDEGNNETPIASPLKPRGDGPTDREDVRAFGRG